VKGKVVSGVLAVAVTLALSAAMAHAGAGGIPSALTSFFVCHGIHGDQVGQNFDVESPVFGPTDAGSPILQGIKLGKATLACAFARLFPSGSTEPIEPGEGPELKCYQITATRKVKVKPPTQYLAFDALAGEEGETVSVPASNLQYLCAPSIFFPQ
jgi:hypothetical protein